MLINLATGDTDKNTSGLSNQRDKDTSEKLDDEDFLTSHPLLENKWNSSFKGWSRRLQTNKSFMY